MDSRRHPVIQLETGWERVKREGINPFIELVESDGGDKLKTSIDGSPDDDKPHTTMDAATALTASTVVNENRRDLSANAVGEAKASSAHEAQSLSVSTRATSGTLFQAETYVRIYDLVFQMCTQRAPNNWSDQIYERYVDTTKAHCHQYAVPALEAAAATNQLEFLRVWADRWQKQQLFIKGLANLHMYLDKYYTEHLRDRRKDVFPLVESAYRVFRQEVFDRFQQSAVEAILDCVQREREDKEDQDRHLLARAVMVFVEMGFNIPDVKLQLYVDHLEKRILSQAGSHYSRMAALWDEQLSVSAYLVKAEAALTEERDRVESYLNQHTMEPLMSECFSHLLRKRQSALLTKQTGLVHMLKVDRRDDIARISRLFHLYPDCLPLVATIFGQHVTSDGTAAVDKAQRSAAADGADNEHQLVRDLIELHRHNTVLVRDCCSNNHYFQKAIKQAFEEFINRDNRVSKLLAKFVHELLKKGNSTARMISSASLTHAPSVGSSSEVAATLTPAAAADVILDNVVFLYGYITEKDVFERDYQLYLATRLLEGLCESEHAEKSMIARLKTQAGYQWTNKLEGMFRDIQLSRDVMVRFNRFIASEPKGQSIAAAASLDPHTSGAEVAERALGLALDVRVCNKGVWPSVSFTKCTIPSELLAACDAFARFYASEHRERKIDWRMDQGKAEVQVAFSKTVRRTLVVTPYQMLILCVFNDAKVVTFQQLIEMTGIPGADMARHLLSLAHPRTAILLKRPNSRELAPDHRFTLNGKFTSQLLRLQVPLIMLTGPHASAKEEELDAALERQRSHQMDAAIVRIMKIRKTLTHAALVSEVVSQLNARFRPNPSVIKRRIEALLEQEYIERDAESRSSYNYIA